jgi:hypothetical protein
VDRFVHDLLTENQIEDRRSEGPIGMRGFAGGKFVSTSSIVFRESVINGEKGNKKIDSSSL